MKPNVEAIVSRAMLLARALGFLFLIYFVPVLLRDLLGAALPGGGLAALLTGGSTTPAVPIALSLGTLALSVLFAVLHARSDEQAPAPRPLLRADRTFARQWCIGFLGGVALIVAVHLPLVLSGVVRIDAISTTWLERPGLLVLILAALVAESFREELAFRGPSQRDLTRVTGFPLAALFLSGTFTFLHLANPNADTTSLLGVFLAGLALAGVVRAEGDLALAGGLHAGWNVALGMIVSVPVSGIRLGTRLLETSLSDDPLWSGGHFGFEASLPGITLLFVAGYLAWRWKGRG